MISRCNSGPVPMSHRCSKSRFTELFVVVHGQTLFLYAPCCACRSSAPLRGALLSCVDKKVTKEATRGGTEVDPIENLWFRIPSPRIKTVLPGTSPGKTLSVLWFLSSLIRSNSDLSSCLWLLMVIRCFFMHRAVHVGNLLPCGGRYFLVSTRK